MLSNEVILDIPRPNLYIWGYLTLHRMLIQWSYTAIHLNHSKKTASNCNTKCNTKVIAVTGLYMSTIMMLGISSHWEGICELKPAQASCSLWSLFCLLLPICTLCLAQTHTHFLPSVLASSDPHCVELSFHQLWLLPILFPELQIPVPISISSEFSSITRMCWLVTATHSAAPFCCFSLSSKVCSRQQKM